MRFTYKTGSLRIDCNETGFTADNVRALCAIRRSTKSGESHCQGYTGEKGIGFKSVFSIADEVWIASREYRFKFDKGEEFGMIAPSWATFPEPTLSDGTSLYMRLSDKEDLAKDLNDFDPAMLLFLRRIRKVELACIQFEGQSWVKKIERYDEIRDGNLSRVISCGTSQLVYSLYSFDVNELPPESRRPGYTHSELILAFPIPDSFTTPSFSTQKVYSCLPVGDYGLKVALCLPEPRSASY